MQRKKPKSRTRQQQGDRDSLPLYVRRRYKNIILQKDYKVYFSPLETQCNTTARTTSSSNPTCHLPPAEQHRVPAVALSWQWWLPCSQAGNTNPISPCLAQPLMALLQVAVKLLPLLCEATWHWLRFYTDFAQVKAVTGGVKQPAGHGCTAGGFSETKLTAVLQITACWASLRESY